MRVCGAITVSAALALACAIASGSAQAVESLTIATVSPANGATVTAAHPVPLEVAGVEPGLRPIGIVGPTPNPAQQPDGELYAEGGGGLEETAPGHYTAPGEGVPFDFGFLLPPGLYYWQVVAGTYSVGGQPPRQQLSSVFSFIVAPGSPSLTIPQALGALASSIRDHTGRAPQHLKTECSDVGETEVQCFATWSSSQRAHRRSLFEGKMLVRQANGADQVLFSGSRRRLGCAAHRGRRCRVTLSWS